MKNKKPRSFDNFHFCIDVADFSYYNIALYISFYFGDDGMKNTRFTHRCRGEAWRVCFHILAAMSLVLLMSALLTSCGSAGGRSASDWKGMWYREGDSPFSRCYAEISNVSSEGFDFSLTVYNGNKAGEMVNCHAVFQKKVNEYIQQDTDFDEDNAAFFKENVPEDSGYAAYYFAEDPRSYIEFAFDESDKDKLDISFVTTGNYTEWTAFEGFQENAQITGIFSHKEEYINDSLYEMGVLSRKCDDNLQKMMGDDVYFRLLCCFQIHREERSEPTGSNLPYEYGGTIHMHDGLGGTIHYGSMVNQQYGACIIEYDDGTVSAAVSFENEAPSYYSNNKVYEKEHPYIITMWLEQYAASK